MVHDISKTKVSYSPPLEGLGEALSQYNTYYAIVDCNSFYCGCERLFKPQLHNKPVVVLSNNDGCVISRSDEAKKVGIPMGATYFEYKKLLDSKEVATFSSNYNLYGDMSSRVMDTLRSIVGTENVEVYSIDEAFITLNHIPKENLHEVIVSLKTKVERWTGIKVSVGAAPTKTLSKVANRLAKKNKLATNCILVLENETQIIDALKSTAIADVWGVGRSYAHKLKNVFNIYTAYDLAQMSEGFGHTYLGGVVGKRLIRELNGIPSITMKEELVSKKMIMTTRMFGKPVTSIAAIKEAVATYTSRAAEKLRRQYGATQYISIFVVAKNETDIADYRGNTLSAYTNLTHPTANTNELIKAAVQLVDAIATDGKPYKKAGVLLSSIVPDTSIQGNLFVPHRLNTNRLLMEAVDNINFSQRDDVLKFAASGTTRNWKMRQNFISKRHTTRWDELFEVS